jgi:hypothetical protein
MRGLPAQQWVATTLVAVCVPLSEVLTGRKLSIAIEVCGDTGAGAGVLIKACPSSRKGRRVHDIFLRSRSATTFSPNMHDVGSDRVLLDSPLA